MGSSQEKSETSTSAPLAAQMPYLNMGWQQASNALTNANNMKAPDAFVAQMTPDQLANFRQMAAYGGNSTLPGQMASNGTALAGGGSDGILNAIRNMQNFQPTGSVDSTIADANKYANNAAIPGMVDAAMRDARRNAAETTLPGIAQGAASTGNLNSSRTAIAQGMVDRGLQEKAADLSANFRGAAYDKGLTLANDANKFNTTANLTNNSALASAGNSASTTGFGAMSGAIGDQTNLFNLANAGTAGAQQADQLGINNELAKYGFGANSQFDALKNYWSIVGNQNWGGTKTGESTTTNNPGALQYAGLGLNALGMFL